MGCRDMGNSWENSIGGEGVKGFKNLLSRLKANKKIVGCYKRVINEKQKNFEILEINFYLVTPLKDTLKIRVAEHTRKLIELERNSPGAFHVSVFWHIGWKIMDYVTCLVAFFNIVAWVWCIHNTKYFFIKL